MLEIIVPPDSSGSTVPQIAGYDLGAESLTNEQKWPSAVVLQRTESRFSTNTKTTQTEVRIDRPVTEFRSREVSVDQGAFLALSHSLREKLSLLLVVSAAWLPSRRWGVERSSSFYWVQKTWTLGRSPVSPPMVLNFKICT